ncbi:MAG: hypothetical protein Q9216_004357 [Gyalolechia sp. 2 TL-2023]
MVQCDCAVHHNEPVALGTKATSRLRHYDGGISFHLPNCDQVVQQRIAARSKGLAHGEADKVWLDDYSTVEVLHPVQAYDPKTIIQDIMRADGFHPTLPPLNAHLYDLSRDRLAERPPNSKRLLSKARKRSDVLFHRALSGRQAEGSWSPSKDFKSRGNRCKLVQNSIRRKSDFVMSTLLLLSVFLPARPDGLAASVSELPGPGSAVYGEATPHYACI